MPGRNRPYSASHRVFVADIITVVCVTGAVSGFYQTETGTAKRLRS